MTMALSPASNARDPGGEYKSIEQIIFVGSELIRTFDITVDITLFV